MLFGPITGGLPHFQLSSNLCRLDLTNLLRHDLSQAPEGQITGHAGGGLPQPKNNKESNKVKRRQTLKTAGVSVATAVIASAAIAQSMPEIKWRMTWMIAKYDELNPAALKRLLANGVMLHGFSPAIMEACFNAAKELHAEIAKDNASFKKVEDLMNAFTNNGYQIYQWFQVAKLNYDVFMVRHSRG